MEHVIEISGLKKYFKDVKAVDDISFSVREGELFAFLGLNGAGKSTTISILCGQLSKDAGTVKINGTDIEEDSDSVKAQLGVVFQSSLLDQVLTVRDNLRTRAACYGITGEAFSARVEEVSTLLDFKELLNRPLGKLSGGQRRRIDIARAILHRPRILVLDEPTTGLDPQSRKTVWDVINRLRAEEKLTVFLTTHYMEEAGEADTVVILDSGKIVAQGTPLELKNRYTGDQVKLYGVEPAQVAANGLEYTLENDAVKLSVKNTAEVKKLIEAYPALFEDFEVIKGRMDDVFLRVTGKELKQQ